MNLHHILGGPQSPASGILAFLPPPIDRKAARAFRAALSAHIERMVDVLDTLDGDVDLEDTSDDEDGHDREASDLAGYVVSGIGSDGNLEQDDCDLEHGGDDENTLGWPDSGEGPQPVAAPSCGLEQDVPTGFERVRRAFSEERDATRAETGRLRRILRGLTGAPVPIGRGLAPELGNLRLVTL